jgi:hypothetical protein
MVNAHLHLELLIVKETVFHGLFQIHFHQTVHQDSPLMEMVHAYQFLHHLLQLHQSVLLDFIKILMEIVNQLIQLVYQAFLYAQADLLLMQINKYVIHSLLHQLFLLHAHQDLLQMDKEAAFQ